MKQDVFGYTIVPNEWYQAYIRWWEKMHHFTIREEWMMFCTGVVAAISSMVCRGINNDEVAEPVAKRGKGL